MTVLQCQRCHYQIDISPQNPVCPYCGLTYNFTQQSPSSQKVKNPKKLRYILIAGSAVALITIISLIAALLISINLSNQRIATLEASQQDYEQLENRYEKLKETETEKEANDSTESSSNNSANSKESSNDDKSSAAPSKTREQLDAEIANQPVKVTNVSVEEQDPDLKGLYPDLMMPTIVNNSGTELSELIVAFVAWDSNNLPIRIKTKYSWGRETDVAEGQFTDINLVNGATLTDQGIALDSEEDRIATLKAIVVSYKDFDGNTWNNPLYKEWTALYAGKRL